VLWNEIIWVKEDILAAIVIINNENVNKEGGLERWSIGVMECWSNGVRIFWILDCGFRIGSMTI
jgi:hypothetical protein